MSEKEKNARSRVHLMTESAMIAALYVAATLLLAPISYGPIQFRVSEALTMLPVCSSTSTVGLTIGCAIANAVGVAMGVNSCGVADILFGTAATLLAAVTTRVLRSVTVSRAKLPILSALMPPLFNGLIVGFELSYFFKLPFWLCALQVAGGELAVTLLLGLPLVVAVRKIGLFGQEGLSSR